MPHLPVIFGEGRVLWAVWSGHHSGLLNRTPASSVCILFGDFQNLWHALQSMVLLVILAVAVWMVYWILRPRPAFQIKIQSGAVVVIAGKVRRQFLNDLSDVISRANQQSGTITAPRMQSGRVVFKFSPDIPPELQIQIRNIWYAGL